MSPETEDFLESVRGAEDPTLDDEHRVLRAVQVALAAGAVVGTATAAPKLAGLFSGSAAGGFKTGAAAFCLLALGGLAAVEWLDAPSRVRAPVVAARAHGPAQQLPVPDASAGPAEASSGETPPTPSRPEGRLRASVAIPSASSPASAPASVGSGLRDELAVLARAQAALRRGDGAAALSMLDAFVPREPQLAAERATLRILALCELGRIAEARREATRLERREPGSLQRDVISRSCAGVGESPPR